MLSTNPIGNPSQAKHYFLGHDNYYSENDTLAKERSEWWGKGAKALDLSGPIDTQQFLELLKGHLPDGQQLGKKVDNTIEHRPGFDLTFSVPKSVSLTAFLGGDEQRIIDAMNRAVDKTLSLVERSCAQARITQEGNTTYENTQNLVVAKFTHDLSREADPQLHIHAVVMNMTQRSDGKWRSLGSKSGDYSEKVTSEINGFFERTRHHRRYYDTVFLGELAYEIKQLGYDIVKTDKHGLFEIAGISQKTIDTYSQRSKQIDSYMKEYGFSGAKAAAVATIKTRKAKENLNRETLRELWQERSESNHIDAFQEAKMVVDRATHPEKISNLEKPENLTAAKEAIHYGISHLSETHIEIKEIQLLNVAIQQAVGENVTINSLLQVIKDLQKQGDLISIGKQSGEISFTTKQLLDYERQILMALHQKPKNAKSISPLPITETYLSQQHQLTVEQRTAIKTIFSSENRINLLEGPTGSGKTTLIKPMMELAKLNGYQAILLTPSKAASLDLKNQLYSTPTNMREWFKELFNQNEFSTVSQFIKNREKAVDQSLFLPKKGIIFLDNATQISSKQMCDLIHIAEKTNKYLVPIGDKRTVLGFQSGTPFTQMIENHAVFASLKKNMRAQENNIREAISDTLQNHMAVAFDKVGHRILSIENKEKRLEAIAQHYMQVASDSNKKTVVLMSSKSQCEEINNAIRIVLKHENKIHFQSILKTVLLPKSMSEAQYSQVKNYEAGQWVRFNENYRSLEIQRGEYLKINAIYPRRNMIVLENTQGKTIHWNPKLCGGKGGSVEVFEQKQRELAVGDKLVWKRNNKKLNTYNGELLTLTSIKKDILTLERENQKKITINLKEMASHHFDYGYSTTPLQKQHTTFDHLIAYQNSFSRQTNKRSFYKLLSQAKENVWIYTENKEQLLRNLQNHTGDKLTAIDSAIYDNELIKNNGSSADYIILLEKALIRTIEHSKQIQIQDKNPTTAAKNAISYALAHLTEREAAFEHKQVLEIALKQVLGEVDVKTLQAAILQAEKNGELIRGIYSKDGTRWTTRQGIDIEQEILQLAKQDKGRITPIATADLIEKHVNDRSPKSEHAEAVRAIASLTDRYLLVQGFAGTGKTTMLMHVEPLLRKQGYELLSLAPTHVAVKELKERGLNAQTLDSFIIDQQKNSQGQSYQNKLVIALDENSMTSNQRMVTLLRIMQTKQIRGIFIGDKKQHPAISAGKPHTLLENQIKTIYLTDIERQKDPTLLQAVKESYQGDFATAFKTLGDRIVEIGKERIDRETIDNPDKRLELICDDYLSRSPEKRAQTLVITLGNEDRVLLNELIREGLKAEGELSDTAFITKILVPRDLSEIERTRAVNYKAGDIIRFGHAEKTIGIEKNDYVTVRSILKEDNYLMLEKSNGQTLSWQPRLIDSLGRVGVEVYRSDEREIRSGDLIRWTRTQKSLGLYSPELAQVKSIEPDQITLAPLQKTKDGMVPSSEIVVIQPKEAQYQHWDHAYVMTGYSAQSKTVSEALILLESYHKNLTHQAAFIVALTRAQYNLKIYTDDKTALLKQLFSKKGEKTSSLETIGEWSPASSQSTSTIVKSEASLADKPYLHQAKVSFITQKEPLLDSKRITDMLQGEAEKIVEKLLGEPKERSSQQYRYGSKQGSLVVTMQGEKRGLWHDFQTGEGGHLLHLIAKQSNLDIKQDFKKVLEQAAHLLGTSATLRPNQKRIDHIPLLQDAAPKILSKTQQSSMKYARQLARESLPIKGTLAEKYLQEHRLITLDKLPNSFRFHPGIYSKKNESIHPALVVIAKDENGKVQAVQAIFLNEKTAAKADVKIQKQTWGLPSSGATADLVKSNNPSAPIYLAEGPETALSIFTAMPQAHVKITLGKSNFKNINPNASSKDIVLCLDNDGNNPSTDKLINYAAERLKKMGKNVWVAKPDEIKKDYNDLLKEQGTQAIRTNIERAVPHEDFQHKTQSSLTLKSEVLDKQLLLQSSVDKNLKAYSTVLHDKTKLENLMPSLANKLARHLPNNDLNLLKQAAVITQSTNHSLKTIHSSSQEQIKGRESSISDRDITPKTVAKRPEKEQDL